MQTESMLNTHETLFPAKAPSDNYGSETDLIGGHLNDEKQDFKENPVYHRCGSVLYLCTDADMQSDHYYKRGHQSRNAAVGARGHAYGRAVRLHERQCRGSH